MPRRGRSGPPPKPPQLKSIEGGRKSPLQARVGEGVKMTPGIPERPALYDAEAEAEWERLTEELDPYGLVSLADRGLLVLICNAWARYQELSARLAKIGPEEFAIKEFNALDKAQNTYGRFALEFGMSPSARSRVAVAPKKAPNKWAKGEK